MPSTIGFADFKPKGIIIHAMAEFIDTANEDYFAPHWLAKLGLSCHALVTPSGVIIRCRGDDEGAYHARGHNQDNLGVEFLVPGLHTYATFLEGMKEPWVSEAQYDAGLALVRGWMKTYEIRTVTRHMDLDPQRKFDPGQFFPHNRFVEDLNK